MEQVKLVDLIWRGWYNQHLRALSHRSSRSLIVVRKVNEAVLLQAILSITMEKKWDIDDNLLISFARHRPVTDLSKPHLSSEEV